MAYMCRGITTETDNNQRNHSRSDIYGPSIEKTLDFLDADFVLVLPLHVVDVVGDAGHSRQGHDDVRVAASAAIAVLHDVLQEQVVLEDALHRFQQVRAQR